jgi:hypothetical protein
MILSTSSISWRNIKLWNFLSVGDFSFGKLAFLFLFFHKVLKVNIDIKELSKVDENYMKMTLSTSRVFLTKKEFGQKGGGIQVLLRKTCLPQKKNKKS